MSLMQILQAFPLSFAYCKQSKTRRWEGLRPILENGARTLIVSVNFYVNEESISTLWPSG